MKLTDIKLPENMTIEDVLCLGHLIGKRVLPHSATIQDSTEWHEECGDCKYNSDCPSCVMNE